MSMFKHVYCYDGLEGINDYIVYEFYVLISVKGVSWWCYIQMMFMYMWCMVLCEVWWMLIWACLEVNVTNYDDYVEGLLKCTHTHFEWSYEWNGCFVG